MVDPADQMYTIHALFELATPGDPFKPCTRPKCIKHFNLKTLTKAKVVEQEKDSLVLQLSRSYRNKSRSF